MVFSFFSFSPPFFFFQFRIVGQALKCGADNPDYPFEMGKDSMQAILPLLHLRIYAPFSSMYTNVLA